MRAGHERIAAGAAALAVMLLVAPAPALAAEASERAWSDALKSAEVRVAILSQGRGEALEVVVRPARGVAITPAAIRIDAAALIRARIKAALPATVRPADKDGAAKGGMIRAVLPLDAPGALRIATPDSHDGTLRVEYRYCLAGAPTCAVERLDLAMKARRE